MIKGKFIPMTCASEMAVLISRIDEGVEIIDKQSNIGEIVSRCKIEYYCALRNNVRKTYKVIDQYCIYRQIFLSILEI